MALSRRTGARFQASIWPGFVDAMTGLLLVLTFVLTIFMIVQSVLRDTITGQENELDSLSTEIAALAQALGVQERRNTDLTGKLGELESTLSSAELRLAEQVRIIDTLTVARDRQALALDAAQGRITAFEDQVAALLSERDAARADITGLRATQAELEAARNSLVSERDALNLALASARGEIDAQVEAARLDASRREALQALIEDLRAQNAEAAGQVTTLTGRLDTLTEQLTAEEAAKLAESEAAAALRKRLEQADAELTAMTMALESERKRAEETLTLLAAARSAETDLNARLALALLEGEDEAQALQTRLDQAQAEVANLAATLADTRAAGIETDDRLTTLREDLSQERQARATAERALDEERKSREAVERDLAAARGETGAAQSRMSDLSAQLAAALARVTEAKSLQTELDALRARNEALVADLSASQSAALETGQALQTENARLTAALQTARERDDRRDELIATLRDALAEAEARAVERVDDAQSLEEKLAAALASRLSAEATAEETREKLAAALAAKKAAETNAATRMSEAEERQVLLAQAREELALSEERTSAAQKQAELLNQQVAALRQQLGELQGLLDASQASDEASQVQLQNLGSELNAALARVAAEERRRRQVEEDLRIAAEAQAKDLERYRSEFFGRLREVLSDREGIRIEGDRFVFSSEVLFQLGEAELSDAGKAEIAKVANLLRDISDQIPAGIDWIIRVDGHTDDVPLRPGASFQDNWELSQQRALSVVRYMIDFLDIPPQRLAANGFGQYQPIDPAKTPEARAQNRRIELKLTER